MTRDPGASRRSREGRIIGGDHGKAFSLGFELVQGGEGDRGHDDKDTPVE